jgi:hypothetical protein
MTRMFAMLVAASCVAAAAAGAQEPESDQGRGFLTTYGVSFPVGDTRQFVSAVSWMGATWEGQWPLSRHTVGGVEIGLTNFSDRTDGTRLFDWGAVTGNQISDLTTGTLLATWRWHLGRTLWRGPFVGVAAGLLYASQAYQLGVLPQIGHDALHLAVAPEVGAIVPMFDVLDVVLRARYTLPNSGGHYLGGNARSFRYVTLGFGVIERY